MIDLRRLHVLRAVAHYGTVTGAARSLHLSTSAASQQIRQLAGELGVTLLEPHGRRVRLSPAAHVLLAHADAIEAMWKLAESELYAAEGDPGGTLRLCGFPTAVATLLAPLVRRVQDSYPAMELRLREAEPSECFDLLFAGSADLAVVEATLDNPSFDDIRFDQRPLFDDPFDIVVSAKHRFADRAQLTLAEATRESWVLGVPGSASRQHVLAACTSAGFSPNIAHEAREWAVVAALVAADLGVALIPRLADLPPHLDLRRVPVHGPNAPFRHFLTATLRGSRERPAVAATLSMLDEIVAQTVGDR